MKQKIINYFDLDQGIVDLLDNDWNNLQKVYFTMDMNKLDQLELCKYCFISHDGIIDWSSLMSLQDEEFRTWFFKYIDIKSFIKLISYKKWTFDDLSKMPWLFDYCEDLVDRCLYEEQTFLKRYDFYNVFNNRELFEKGHILEKANNAYYINRFYKVLTIEEKISILEKFNPEDWQYLNYNYLKDIDEKTLKSLQFISELKS